MMSRAFLAAWWLTLGALAVRADVRLPKIFSSHAVLQRDQPLHVWGWAEPGEAVTVTLNGASGSATADRLGQWEVYLASQKAGGPYQFTVAGRNRIAFDDVLIGDVWFASGQSNMEMPLKGFPGSAVLKNGAEEIAQANHPDMRLLFVPHKPSPYPLDDFDGKVAWSVCTPETAADFSAVAYFFGREIAAREHVPVGLIDSTWGGTPGEAWISMDALTADASLMPVFATWSRMTSRQAEIPAMLAAEKAEDEEARKANGPKPKHDWHPDPRSFAPAGLYNGMVAPAIPFRIAGAIWYQGETNASSERAPFYERVFRTLIGDWRARWQEGAFPFLYVQISSFETSPQDEWGIVRDAQRRALALRKTGMAVTIDVGEPQNIHPADKQSVGARLALAGRALAYGEQLTYAGPLYESVSTEGNAVRVRFEAHTAGGLMAKGGAVEGFEVAGEDHKFSAATARIDGETVIATGASVAHPKYVRYAWASVPAANLFNAEGLPASTFTSEEPPRASMPDAR